MIIAIKIIILGIFATFVIDIWATFSHKVLRLPRTNWAMVGRWLGHISNGQLAHSSMNDVANIQYEHALGWVFHYFIGVMYAACYVTFAVFLGFGKTWFSAWLFGLLTILSPWFIMQPCLGLGFCASKAPKPTLVRLQNFAIHSIFGLSLYSGNLLIKTF